MEEQLSQTQLKQVIAEAQRLATYQSELIGMAEVRQILQELNLPPESLEDALVQVQRRQALAREQKQKRRLIGGAIALISIVIAVPAWLFWQNQQAIARVSVQYGEITSASGMPMPIVPQNANSQVVYAVQLKDAPIGKKLAINCDWINPQKQIAHQNRYETREITTPLWLTRCQYSASPKTPAGKWTVKMFLEGRLLSEEMFEVK